MGSIAAYGVPRRKPANAAPITTSACRRAMRIAQARPDRARRPTTIAAAPAASAPRSRLRTKPSACSGSSSRASFRWRRPARGTPVTARTAPSASAAAPAAASPVPRGASSSRCRSQTAASAGTTSAIAVYLVDTVSPSTSPRAHAGARSCRCATARARVAPTPSISHGSGVAKWQRLTKPGDKASSSAASSPQVGCARPTARPRIQTAAAPASAESARASSNGSAARPETRPARARRSCNAIGGTIRYSGSDGFTKESGRRCAERAISAATSAFSSGCQRAGSPQPIPRTSRQRLNATTR